MKQKNWIRWTMQTARTWEDLAGIIKSTGIQDIDNDHKRMIIYALSVNKLIDQMGQKDIALDIINQQEDLLNRFLRITEEHFQREEEIIKKYNLKGLDVQEEQHSKILKMLRKAIKDFKNGRITVTQNLKLDLLDWVVTHINEIDYKTFKVGNLRQMISRAENWEDLNIIVQDTGLAKVDEQHREIIACSIDISKISNHYLEDKGNKVLHQILKDKMDDLKKLVNIHFKAEEDFMLRRNIPQYEEQRKQHEKFYAILSSGRLQLESGNFKKDHFHDSILSWWINHINGIDFQTFNLQNWAFKILEKVNDINDMDWILKKTGIGSVDKEHLAIIETTLDLSRHAKEHKGINPGSDKVFQEILGKLYFLAQEHFVDEETIMIEKKLPNIQQHHEQHEELLVLLETITYYSQSGLMIFSDMEKAKILYWLLNHVNYIDNDMFKNAV